MSKKWTEAEDRILKDNYQTKTLDELLPLLPGRKPIAIYQRAFNLRLSKKVGDSEGERDSRRHRVRVLAQEGLSQPSIARELGISLSTIRADVLVLKAEGLWEPKPKSEKKPKAGDSKPKKEKAEPDDYSKRLKAWERRVICDFGPTLGLAELKMLLPKMTKDQILESAEAFGIRIKGQ